MPAFRHGLGSKNMVLYQLVGYLMGTYTRYQHVIYLDNPLLLDQIRERLLEHTAIEFLRLYDS